MGTDIKGGDRHNRRGQTKTPWIQNETSNTEEYKYQMLYKNDAKVLIEMTRKFITNFKIRENALKGEV